MLDGSVGETLHSGYVLGKVLAEHAARLYELFDEVLRRLEARSSAGDPRFVRGVISGIETRDPQAARRCVDKALRSSILQKRAVDIFQGLTLSADDLQRVVEQLRAGNIDPASCAHMSYGRGLAGVDANSLAMLLTELIAHGADGCWSALEIASMFLHGRADLPSPIAEKLKSILTDERLLRGAMHRSRDAYLFHSEIERLLKHKQVDSDLVAALVRQLLLIVDLDLSVRFDFEHYSDDILSALISAQQEAVWREIAPRNGEGEPLKRWALERLLAPHRGDRHREGVLFKLPEALYLDWVRQGPERRAPIVAQWLPMTDRPTEGGAIWHPALERFVAEFGQIDAVLETIRSRLYPLD